MRVTRERSRRQTAAETFSWRPMSAATRGRARHGVPGTSTNVQANTRARTSGAGVGKHHKRRCAVAAARDAAVAPAAARRISTDGRGRCRALPMQILQTANRSRWMGLHTHHTATAGENGRRRDVVLCGRSSDGGGGSKRARSPSQGHDDSRAKRVASLGPELSTFTRRELLRAARMFQGDAPAFGAAVLGALKEGPHHCGGCRVNLRKRECQCDCCPTCERRIPECVCDSSSDDSSSDDSSSEDSSGDNDASDDSSNDYGPGGFDPDVPECWNCGSARVTCNDYCCPDCGAEPRRCWQCDGTMDSDDEECPACGAERLGKCAECDSWCMDASAEYCGFCACDYEF